MGTVYWRSARVARPVALLHPRSHPSPRWVGLIHPTNEETTAMAHDETDSTSRRTFLQAGALASASALSLAPGAQAQEAAAKAPTIPRRPLGKTGAEITVLDQGAVRGESLDRILRTSFASGVRVFDTAKAYGSEPNFKKW